MEACTCFIKRTFLILASCLAASCHSGSRSPNKEIPGIFRSIKEGTTYGMGDHIRNSTLDVVAVNDTGISFLLETANGGNDYRLEGFASFVNDSEATYHKREESITLTFRANSVFVSEHGSGGSVGIDFNGEYIKGFTIPGAKEDTGDIACLDSVPNRHLKTTAGIHYSNISDCMNRYTEEEASEDSLKYTVYNGGVEGLFTSYEAVIMARGNFYFAGLVLSDTIRLYTNDPVYLKNKDNRPKTIEEWIPRMTHKEIVYCY